MTTGCTNRPGSNPVVVESEVLVCRRISSLPPCLLDLYSASNNTVRKGCSIRHGLITIRWVRNPDAQEPESDLRIVELCRIEMIALKE